jgi:hypothetical protein
MGVALFGINIEHASSMGDLVFGAVMSLLTVFVGLRIFRNGFPRRAKPDRPQDG